MKDKNFDPETVGSGIPLDGDKVIWGHSIGGAVYALKIGKRVTRKVWQDLGFFVFMQVPSDVPYGFVEKMSSLPKTVKEEFAKRFLKVKDGDETEHTSVRYSNQLALVDKYNNVSSWTPSASDLLADDWIVLD